MVITEFTLEVNVSENSLNWTEFTLEVNVREHTPNYKIAKKNKKQQNFSSLNLHEQREHRVYLSLLDSSLILMFNRHHLDSSNGL